MNNGDEKLRTVAQQAEKILIDLDVIGTMGIYHDPASLEADSLDLVIRTNIPKQLAPHDARRIGRALYILGLIMEEACDSIQSSNDEASFFSD